MTIIRNIWNTLKRAGRSIYNSAPVRGLISGLKKVARPVLGTVGTIASGIKHVTNAIDSSPLGSLIQASPFGSIYNTAKKGVSIVDSLRQGGERFLDGGDPMKIARETVEAIPESKQYIQKGRQQIAGIQRRIGPSIEKWQGEYPILSDEIRDGGRLARGALSGAGNLLNRMEGRP